MAQGPAPCGWREDQDLGRVLQRESPHRSVPDLVPVAGLLPTELRACAVARAEAQARKGGGGKGGAAGPLSGCRRKKSRLAPSAERTMTSARVSSPPRTPAGS